MVDERMTEVRVTRIARDGAEITLERTVPTAPLVEIEWHGREMLDIAAEIAETGDDERRVPEAEIAWRRARDGSHPDVADSGQPSEAMWLRDGEREELRRSIRSFVWNDDLDRDQVAAELRRFGGGAPYERQHGESRTRALAEREDGMDFADKVAIGRRATQRLHAEVGCKCPSKAWSCEPHSSSLTPGICVTHSHAGIESEAPTGSAILKAWQRGWRPGDEPEEPLVPVEPDELAEDRAEQLVAALAVALRIYLPTSDADLPVDVDEMARLLLAHPYVRDALEPARAVVWAEPPGTIVSFRYREDGGVYGKATHLIVKLDEGVTVGADVLGKKVAVAK